jgi:hypothetical protein
MPTARANIWANAASPFPSCRLALAEPFFFRTACVGDDPFVTEGMDAPRYEPSE